MHDYEICSKFTTSLVCTNLFISFGHEILFALWDLAHAKIYKFDFRIGGLMGKLVSQTSSRVRAIIISELQ